jgi:hypothetical protein
MKSNKVLIVDDNELILSLLGNLINQQWTHKTAKNGIEAVELTRDEKFDLILINLQLPILDGIAAFRKISQNNPEHCPIIAISDPSNIIDKDSLLSIGFAAVLVKPIKPNEFMELLSCYLGSTNENSGVQGVGNFAEVIIDKKVIDQLMKYNSAEKINAFMVEFLVEVNQLMNTIHDAFAKRDYNQLCENLHILKGVTGTMGANLIFLSSQKAEYLTFNNRWDDLGNELDKMTKEKIELEAFINSDKIFRK